MRLNGRSPPGRSEQRIEHTLSGLVNPFRSRRCATQWLPLPEATSPATQSLVLAGQLGHLSS